MIRVRPSIRLAAALALAAAGTPHATAAPPRAFESPGTTLSSAGALARLAPVADIRPVEPYEPGDLVWMTEPPVAEGSLNSTGCQRVPSTGYIGTGVYAQSTAQYANYWYWSGGSASQAFYWYLKKTDNSTYTWGYSSGGGGSTSPPANIYYWKVQNQGSSPQAWNVCYDVV